MEDTFRARLERASRHIHTARVSVRDKPGEADQGQRRHCYSHLDVAAELIEETRVELVQAERAERQAHE